MDLQALQLLHTYSQIPIFLLSPDGVPTHVFCGELPPAEGERLAAFLADFCAGQSKTACFMQSSAGLLCGGFTAGETRILCGPARRSAGRAAPPDMAERVYAALPTLSAADFAAAFRLLMHLCGVVPPPPEQLLPPNGADDSEKWLAHELFRNQENIARHSPYREETAVLDCVRLGDTEKLIRTYRAQPQIRYGQMSDEPYRRLFYGGIANTTLITRYAIEGGMDEEEAFSLSDIYIRRMERCRSEQELNKLNEEMALDFTRRVAAAKGRTAHYSRTVRSCMEYIDTHRHERITLTELSKCAHLSGKYLSDLFRRETGRTLTAFICEKKIEEGKNLLTYSAYSVSEIAQYLGFCSQSHFTAAFRRATGLTPARYRKQTPL